MVNKVILMGNLGQDPVFKQFENGGQVANFGLATKEKYTDRNGEKVEKTEWHQVSVYGKQAEVARNYLKKGSPAYIEGKLRTRSYQDKEGVDRKITEVICNQLTLVPGGGGNNGGNSSQTPASKAESNVDGYTQNSGGGSQQPQQSQPASAAVSEPQENWDDEGDDDLPF